MWNVTPYLTTKTKMRLFVLIFYTLVFLCPQPSESWSIATTRTRTRTRNLNHIVYGGRRRRRLLYSSRCSLLLSLSSSAAASDATNKKRAATTATTATRTTAAQSAARETPPVAAASSSSTLTASAAAAASPGLSAPAFRTAECDNVNRPPSLNILLRALSQLTRQGSDIRGTFVDHRRFGSIAAVAHEIARSSGGGGSSAGAGGVGGVSVGGKSQPPLTPLAAYCIGHGLARYLLASRPAPAQDEAAAAAAAVANDKDNGNDKNDDDDDDEGSITLCIGRDPRKHGTRLADALARGAESVRADDSGRRAVRAVYTGLATTPACAAFCSQLNLCDAAVMVTASHLPADKNGIKVYSRSAGSGFSRFQIEAVGALAAEHCAGRLFAEGSVPPSSGDGAVMCSQFVDWMPSYAASLKRAILTESVDPDGKDDENEHDDERRKPMDGLRIVLNAGNGAGGFFASVLRDLGADVSGSIHLDGGAGDFPHGVPNPESNAMLQETIAACERCRADLGIMLDTDADRSGFVVPRTTAAAAANRNKDSVTYEALNRNRLIALLGVVYAETHPGCAIVTDSVTSEGLSAFLSKLGLRHVRYLRGYANVIGKAKELSAAGVCDAQVAIETSGHCALQENGYLDDGTYTACKVVGLLARQQRRQKREEDEAAAAAAAAAAAGDPAAAVVTTAGDGGSGSGGSGAGLLDLIADLQEMSEVTELRLRVNDESLDSVSQVFDYCCLEMERFLCDDGDDVCQAALAAEAASSNDDDGTGVYDPAVVGRWRIDRDNLEGIRIRTGGEGQFFMLRKSLHDPILCLQIEAQSRDEARKLVKEPLLRLFSSERHISNMLDVSVLRDY